MAMPKGMNNVWAGAGWAKAGHAIRHGRPMAEPEFHPLRRQIARQARKAAKQMIFQDFCALPIGRGLNAGNLHLASAAQTLFGAHDGHFAV